MSETGKMLKRALLLSLAALVIALFWFPSELPAAQPPDWTAGAPTKAVPLAPGDFVPGQVLVKFKPSTLAGAITALTASHGMKEQQRIDELDVRILSVAEGQEMQAVAKLSASSLVEYAEPNLLRRSVFTPNDPYYADRQWNLRIINMPEAWEISRGSSDVRVAIVDSGLDLNHADSPVYRSSGYNYVSGNYDVSDSAGHGTFVAGIIAAETNNSIGVASIAPGVRVVMYKEENPATGTLPVSAVASAIANAANNGAKVLNLSLGSPRSSTTESSAIDYAWSKGVLIVAAAGNCGRGASSDCTSSGQIEYPAAYANVLGVGSTTAEDRLADHSTRNSTVDVVAPGQSVYGLRAGGGYTSGSGTSFAAPHVSALAGLIWSVKPSLTNREVGDIIVGTSDDQYPGMLGYGRGRINAYAALVKAGGRAISPTATPTATRTLTPTATRTPTPSPTGTSVSPPSGADNAQALTGPFNYTLDPEQRVDFVLKFKNTGATTWRSSEGYAVKNVERGTTGNLGSCDGLQPGGDCSWNWWVKAGTTPGSYGYRYRMYRGDVGFGDTISVTWTVRGSISISPTPTATPTATGVPTNVTNLSQNSGESSYPAVATDVSGNVHVAWLDNTSGNLEIFYRRWSGSAWSPTENLSQNSGRSEDPAVATDASGNVHVAWWDKTSGNYEILYRRWSAGGGWSATENLSQNSGESSYPAVAAVGAGNVHVVWYDNTSGNTEILYRRWNGSAWSTTENLSQNSGRSEDPVVAADPRGNIHVVWDDNTSGNWEISYRRWNGTAWSPVENLSQNGSPSAYPAVALDASGNMHVAWQDAYEILYRRWNGSAWSSTENLSQNSGESSYPAVAVDASGNVFVVWYDKTPGNTEILHRRWSRSESGWSTTVNLSQNAGRSEDPAVAADQRGNIHVVWDDNAAGNWDILYTMIPATAGLTPTFTPTPIPTGTAVLPPPSPPEITRTVTPTPTSTPSGAAASQLQLAEGWNFISVPGPQLDPSLGAVFAYNPSVTRVNAFQDGNWVSALRGPDGWSGPLAQISDGKGYWVYSSSPATLSLRPKPVDPMTPPPSYPLQEGWSMIGYTSSLAAMPVDSYLASLKNRWISLYRYDPATGWQVARPGGLGFGEVQRGKAYWLYLSAAGMLVP
ncbi:MAG: S8 family serine peptidase [Chloroflexi bacterium]|nr:S8 family serine peptidase [Chloroflexota bacterium]